MENFIFCTVPIQEGSGTDDIKNDCFNGDYLAIPEREIKSLQQIAGYVIHKLYKRFKFTKKGNMNQQSISTLLR